MGLAFAQLFVAQAVIEVGVAEVRLDHFRVGVGGVVHQVLGVDQGHQGLVREAYLRHLHFGPLEEAKLALETYMWLYFNLMYVWLSKVIA